MLFVFTPAGFEGFIRETGMPAPALTPPPPAPPSEEDISQLVSVGARHGIELLD